MFEKFLKVLAASGAQLQQQHRTKANTVNFFQRRTGDVLWKTVTNLSRAGSIRGRSKTRQVVRPLQHMYRVGYINSSPLRVRYPGLNTPIPREAGTELGTQPFYFEEQNDEEKFGSLHFVRRQVEKRGMGKKGRMKREKLTPLERGFKSSTFLGQKMGPPPECEGNNMEDFECICFYTGRLTRMHPTRGRLFQARAFVFIGNHNKIGGYALERASMFRLNQAIARAIKKASKSLFSVDLLEDRTIYQDFFAESQNTRIFAQRKQAGFGIRCHQHLIKICELLGIKDIHCFVEGSTNNYIALTYAFITGLTHQETHQHLADRTRLRVVELSPNMQYFPKIVASPLKSPVKDDSEVTKKERLLLDDYYGEGRFPLKKAPQKPWYYKNIYHQFAEWRKHPYRNMEGKIVRLLADGVVPRWTRKERFQWSQREFKKVVEGEKAMPIGIGMTRVSPPPPEKENSQQ